MTDIRTSSLKEPVDVAHYLFTRLQQVGVRGVHGVPGDYNLVALDYIPKCGLTWVGNANELNAGYAADGYARVKGISALVTTFGVGELSALNAIAGCYSEYVPVVHIVGTPSTLSQRDHQMLHHTLGNGSFSVFMDMSRNISQVTENLIDPSQIADQIDHAITQSWIQSRPVYLTLPTNMVQKKIEGERLKTNLDLAYPPNDAEAEDYAVETILKYLTAAKKPVVVVDACAIRHRALDETRAFVTTSNLPTFVAPMGKGAIDETLPNFGGVYAGDGSRPAVRDMVSESDLVISIGSIKSDFNTAGFTYRTSTLNTIELHSDRCKVRFSEYPKVRMNGVLKKLTAALESGKAKLSVMESPAASTNTVPSEEGSAPAGSEITHAWFWPRMGQWLKDGDVVVTETGTANFGIWETRFPPNVTALSQVLWGSIGWSVGALQGAALAAKEEYGDSRRTILFVGDGSLELTVQEISTCIRRGLKPIIFVICNHGYTIERHIHGMEAEYNDIQEWDYKNLLKVFNAPEGKSKSHVVKTKGELDALFGDETFSAAPYIQLVELHMPKEDAPLALKLTAEASAKVNSRES